MHEGMHGPAAVFQIPPLGDRRVASDLRCYLTVMISVGGRRFPDDGTL